MLVVGSCLILLQRHVPKIFWECISAPRNKYTFPEVSFCVTKNYLNFNNKKQECKGTVHEVLYALTSYFLDLIVLFPLLKLQKTVARRDVILDHFHSFLTEYNLVVILSHILNTVYVNLFWRTNIYTFISYL